MTAAAASAPTRRLAGAFPGIRRRARAGGLVLADQGLISAANFATTVLAARAMSPGGFGAFALAYVGLASLNAVVFALVAQPHNVLGARLEGGEYRRLTGTTLVLQLAVIAFAVLSVTAVLGGNYAFAGSFDSLLVAVLPALAAWQLQDYLRRTLFTRARYAAVLWLDIVSYGTQPVLFWLLWRSSALTPETALWAVAATSAAGVLVALWQTRASLAYIVDRPMLREVLTLGRWLAGGQVLYVLSNHGYLVITALIAGTVATGSLRAALTIVGPLNVLFIAFDSVLPSSYARSLERGGEEALAARVRETFLATAIPVAVFCAGVAIFAGPLLHLAFGADYRDTAPVLAVLGAQAFIAYLGRVLLAALRAQRRTREVFVSYAWSVGLSLPLGIALTFAWGGFGAALAMLAGAVVVLVYIARQYRMVPSQRRAT